MWLDVVVVMFGHVGVVVVVVVGCGCCGHGCCGGKGT